MGDFNGQNYKDSFIGDLVDFVAGDDFQTMFEKFFLQHALEFTNDEEHKLIYYEIYQVFHDLFEKQLGAFCDRKNISQTDFVKNCREASEDDPKARRYVDILLSSIEYDTFVKLMKIMRPVAVARLALQAEAKKEQSIIDEYVEEAGSKKNEHDSLAKAGSKEDGYQEFNEEDCAKRTNDGDEYAGAKSSYRADDNDKDSAK